MGTRGRSSVRQVLPRRTRTTSRRLSSQPKGARIAARSLQEQREAERPPLHGTDTAERLGAKASPAGEGAVLRPPFFTSRSRACHSARVRSRCAVLGRNGSRDLRATHPGSGDYDRTSCAGGARRAAVSTPLMRKPASGAASKGAELGNLAKGQSVRDQRCV